ncbi:MAG: hypothetical protein NTX84_09040, partial [Nitrospirae bacterium]|nr:hypothetical protein [Nitrospirota bacterium]
MPVVTSMSQQSVDLLKISEGAGSSRSIADDRVSPRPPTDPTDRAKLTLARNNLIAVVADHKYQIDSLETVTADDLTMFRGTYLVRDVPARMGLLEGPVGEAR